jgi:hypothetical protein
MLATAPVPQVLVAKHDLWHGGRWKGTHPTILASTLPAAWRDAPQVRRSPGWECAK